MANPKPQSREPRQCTGPCGRVLPWEAFTVDHRDANGDVTRRKAKCPDCLREQQTAYRRRLAATRKRTNGIARVPAPWEWVRTKVCSMCGADKPWAMYSPVVYWPDGQVRRVQCRCRDCRNKIQRGYKAPASPKRLAYIADWKRKERVKRQRERAGRGRHYPVGPFVAWLRIVEADEGGLSCLAGDAGLHPDTLTKVVYRNKVVAEKTAEAALCARGLMLADLYGHDDELAA